MAIELSALQTLLEEGDKDGWLDSPFIVRLIVIATIFLTAFIWIELKVSKPLVDLRLLKNRSFGIGTLANVFVGVALFGSVYVLPQYLGQVQHYNAEQIGEVLATTALPQLILIPFVPRLMKLVDVRYIAMTGIGLFAVSFLMNTHMSSDYSGPQFLIPNMVRAVGQSLLLTPLSTIATGEISPKDAANASALFNMLRNLGGAIGTALIATVITTREQFHSNIIGQFVTANRGPVATEIARMQGYFASRGVSDPAEAHHQAVIALAGIVRRQAFIMGFSDAFAVMGAVLALAAASVLLIRKPAASAQANAGAH